MTREDRRTQLEAFFQAGRRGELLAIYLRTVGHEPVVGSFIIQDWIPQILDREFPAQ